MNTYIIGDVQGCYHSLLKLLEKINYNPNCDRLGFVGDLINRGTGSLETMRFILKLKNPLIVLGNHDLHFLALCFVKKFHEKNIDHTLHDMLSAPDRQLFVDFLLQQPFLQSIDDKVMVHAGIPPQWSIQTAFSHALEAQRILQKNPIAFFENIYGNKPASWDDQLTGWARTRYITNAFTRMRFCKQDGTLDLENKTEKTTNPQFKPWFDWVQFKETILFGHWASLEGRCGNPKVVALDTGCGWGGRLTAISIHTSVLTSVSADPLDRKLSDF